jgi:hypothetical protein
MDRYKTPVRVLSSRLTRFGQAPSHARDRPRVAEVTGPSESVFFCATAGGG